ncbi:lipopolysaccharide biosynthesis protein [Rubrivirga sp. S365]|uniref:lipopolysaccharide biosynthesis protein n=1 Tax=Rubrivirga sp. S365 TaxID=3076080 RepID=UPI0028C62094|nr:lipopolysaccharide biosynthesis protein [Rubrivirga sp. S365]MDT7857638.1 lipopolysaccharide biosynthesis protein [Rubrivirga sp. S365]
MTPRLRRLRAQVAGRPLLGPALTLAGGAAAAQALAFAARPALTRLFTPEAFGVLTVVTTVLAVASTVASGGYRAAILLPRGGADRASVVALALACALGATGAAAFGVWAAPWLGLASGATALALAWLPPALLSVEAGGAAETWLTGRGQFRAVSAARFAQSAVTVGVQLAVGLTVARTTDGAAVGLVGGVAAGFAAGAVVSWSWLALADGRLWEGVTRARVVALARRYARFPAFSAPAALLNVLATRVPVFALVAFYGEAVVGQFGVAFGTLVLPLGLVAGSVGQAFFPRAADARWTGGLPALTRAAARGLWGVCAYPALAALVAGPTLFAFVFGAEWAEAGRYAQRIAPWVLLASVAPPLTSVFDVLERQRDELAISAVMFAVQATVLVWAGRTLAPLDAVLAAGVAGAALRALHLGWIFRAAGVPLGGAAADAARALGRALPFAAAVALADALGAGGAVVFAVAAAAGVGALAWEARRGGTADRANAPDPL